MIAVIATGGKQYLVKTGEALKIEKLPEEWAIQAIQLLCTVILIFIFMMQILVLT